ncbi:MAG: Flp pilus assembly complex ATPase component TadA [Clostridia bacterium]|nr:Flp pilus assembly complex ATPase component TadA [Clostridia bacterium]
MDWRLIVPGEPGWDEVDWAQAREVRLRPGQSAAVTLAGDVWRGSYVLSPKDVLQAAQALTNHSLAARQEQLSQGFVPLAGGHRLGVCGVMGAKGFTEITSLCVRIAHEIRGVGEGVFPLLRGASALIVGPPGSGKTTLLRDLVRLFSLDGTQVGVADERGEIAGCREGMPQLDVRQNTDVVTGVNKAKALSLLIRAMAPQMVATDEIGGPEDAAALMEAAKCGVRILATAHGTGIQDVKRRQGMDALFRERVFDRLIVLTAPGRVPVIEEIKP